MADIIETLADMGEAVVNGNPTARALVNTLTTTPTLINPGFSVYPNQSKFPFAIPLETETHKQTGSAQVSESLVITKTNKRNMADNVAPGAWQWTLSGYIPGFAGLEKTNLFTPFVKFNTNLLKFAFKNAYLLIFKDIDCQIYQNVVIKNLDISSQADCRNKTPFSMTLIQLDALDDIVTEIGLAGQTSQPAIGTLAGKAAQFGATMGLPLAADALSGLLGLL